MIHKHCEKRGEGLRNRWRSDMAQNKKHSKTQPLLPRINHEDEHFQDRQSGLDPIHPTFEDAAMEMVKKVRENRADRESRNAINAQKRSATRLFGGLWSRKGPDAAIVRKRQPRPSLEATTALGQYLLDAAFLYEAMARYPDVMLLEKFLFCDEESAHECPKKSLDDHTRYLRPLHPRRTLDQADIWKVKTTRHLDRDQVVYRHTKANFIHKFRPRVEAAEQPVGESRPPVSDPRSGIQDDSERRWHWTGHGVYEDEYGCSRCLEDISKLARVIMVDQLWMWILDDRTILTCFPRRYGIVGTDHSGVHHTLMTRLRNRFEHENRARSVWELGLIIIRGCFNTIFERTSKLDARPAVMDIFAESMGKVVRLEEVLS